MFLYRCTNCQGDRSCSKQAVHYPNLCRRNSDEIPILKSSADLAILDLTLFYSTAIPFILIELTI